MRCSWLFLPSFDTLGHQVFIVDLVLDGMLADLKSTMVAHELLQCPCIGLPLFLLALLPVMLPKVVVWLKDGQIVGPNAEAD